MHWSQIWYSLTNFHNKGDCYIQIPVELDDRLVLEILCTRHFEENLRKTFRQKFIKYGSIARQVLERTIDSTYAELGAAISSTI